MKASTRKLISKFKKRNSGNPHVRKQEARYYKALKKGVGRHNAVKHVTDSYG